MLSAASLAPSRARRRRRIIALAALTTSVLGAGTYLADHSVTATPTDPPLVMLDATELAPHVVVFSAPLAHKDDKTGSEKNDSGSEKKSDDKSSDKGGSDTKGSKKKGSGNNDSGNTDSGDSSSKTSAAAPTGSSRQSSAAGWPTGSTTFPTASGGGTSPSTATGSGWGNLAPGGRAASALPPGIKASVPNSATPVPASAGTTSQVPCTSRVSDTAALEKAVAAAENSPAVICMNSDDRDNASAPASAPSPTSRSGQANTPSMVPPVSSGSSLPTASPASPASPPVTAPSGYTGPTTTSSPTRTSPTPTSQQSHQAQMLRQISCPSSMSQGSVCFEAVDDQGAAASLPSRPDLGQLPVVPARGSNTVSCPTQLENNNTRTTKTTHEGTTTIEKTSKGNGKTDSSEAKDSDSPSSPDSTVASCGLLSYAVTPSDGGSS